MEEKIQKWEEVLLWRTGFRYAFLREVTEWFMKL